MPKTKRQTINRPSTESGPPIRESAGALVGLIAFGLALRVLVAATTLGSNDVALFWNFGLLVGGRGLFPAYEFHPELNHPPIPVLWAEAAVRLVRAFGGEVDSFCRVFKIPMLLAEAGATWVIWRIWSARLGTEGGLWAAAAFAWALAPILVSGYHGNTDPVYAFLSLLAVYLLADRKRPLLAGLALGAAINVKLIPVLLIPPLLLSLRSWREAGAFVGGLAVCALPFVPVFAAVGPDFYRNALAYNPKPDRWGPMLPLLWNRELPLDPTVDRAVLFYQANGRYLILAMIAAWTAFARWRGVRDAYELATVPYAVFLALAPGFGAQYTTLVAPLLVAARPGVGLAYSTLAGLCLLVLYYFTWEGEFPPASTILGYIPHASAVFGAAACAVLAWYVISAVVRAPKPAPGGSRSKSLPPDRTAP